MHAISIRSVTRSLLVLMAVGTAGSVSAQQQSQPDPTIIVTARPPVDAASMSPGPEIKGVISARNRDRIRVTTADGASTTITVNDATRIRAGGGLLGGGRNVRADSLLNGLPVTIRTLLPAGGQPGAGLVASQISFKNNDLKTATMIRNGTAQRFDEQRAATEALRGRMGDIDKYNIKSTMNVHFDVGKAELSTQDKADLCATASSAGAVENALMLVVGYTDSTGSDDLNQRLSEKRASRVINYLQQVCGWKPYRMLTPTGMAKADPAASNDTPEGKAQNRRVSVNVLVSKSVDGL